MYTTVINTNGTIYVLEKNDPAYVMQIPKSVLEYDEEQMPENPRNKRSPLGDDE